jgi:hypothetical protein
MQGFLMKFSYSAVWNDSVELIRSNAAILMALAGVFFFLPSLAFLNFFPPPQGSAGGDPNAALQLILEYYKASMLWMLLVFVVKSIGTISMLMVLLGPRTTVGGAIASSPIILPFYIAATLLAFIAGMVGLLFLIVPGLYLFGRLVLVGPVVVVEGQRNPLAAITRSLALTKGNGWAVVGLFILIVLTGYVLISVAVWIVGSVLTLAVGKDIGAFLALLIQTLGGAALDTVIVALTASLYRALAGEKSAGA